MIAGQNMGKRAPVTFYLCLIRKEQDWVAGERRGAWNLTAPSTRKRTMVVALGAMLPLIAADCGGDARVELSAADSMEALGASMTQALAEYHADLARFDEERQRAAVQAFLERVRADFADESATDGHAKAFQQVLRRLAEDRQAAWERYTLSLDNVATLHEIASGLRGLALDTLSLDDELRRYFGGAIERRREAKERASGRQVTRSE